jgi:hypothetical protein
MIAVRAVACRSSIPDGSCRVRSAATYASDISLGPVMVGPSIGAQLRRRAHRPVEPPWSSNVTRDQVLLDVGHRRRQG